MTPDNDSATPSTPTTTETTTRTYSPRGDIDKQLLADIQTGRDVLATALDPAFNPALVTRVSSATLKRLQENIALAADNPDSNLCEDVINTKKAAVVATENETKAHEFLMAALRVIQKIAGNAYRKDPARRAAYLIGQKGFGNERAVLEADASAIINLAKTDTVAKFLPTDMTDAEQELEDWKAANQAQHDAQNAYAQALQALRDMVALINEDRRTIQVAADVLFPVKPASNGPTRRAFLIPANRPVKV